MIHMLLGGQFLPITSEVGFLACSAERVRDAYIAWMRPLQAKRGVGLHTREIYGDLRKRIASLLPLTNIERRRCLLLPTKGYWTAYLDCGWRGTDAAPPVSYLAGVIGCWGVRAVSVPDSRRKIDSKESGDFGANMLEVYSQDILSAGHNTLRSIYAGNDGGRWTFETVGEPLDFEELEHYKARRVQDRFTPEILNRYLLAMGIDFFSTEFYQVSAPAHLISKEGPFAPGMREYSLEEARGS